MIISEREFPLQSKSNFLDIMYVAEVIKKGLFPLWVTKELLSTEKEKVKRLGFANRKLYFLWLSFVRNINVPLFLAEEFIGRVHNKQQANQRETVKQ